jgi:hypothetical protein
MRLSPSSAPGAPKLLLKSTVKMMGKIMKNKSWDRAENTIKVSFQAIAMIFFTNLSPQCPLAS